MKAWNLLVVLALGGALVAACSSSSSSSSNGTNNPFKCGTPGSSSTDASCNTCVQSHCSAQFTTAFGSDGTGGACAAFVSCINACSCSDFSCMTKCQPSADCNTATQAMTQCEQSSCATECKIATTSDAGADTAPTSEAGAGGCAALATCCPTLPSSAQSGCTNLASSGNDANCNQALSGFQQGGYCK